MIEIAIYSLEFIIVFLIVYLISYFTTYKKIKKFNRKKLPVNVSYMINKYKIDVVKIGYKRVVKILMLSDSFIVAILFLLTNIVDNIYIKILSGALLVIPTFMFVYSIVGKYLRREECRNGI